MVPGGVREKEWFSPSFEHRANNLGIRADALEANLAKPRNSSVSEGRRELGVQVAGTEDAERVGQTEPEPEARSEEERRLEGGGVTVQIALK